MAKELEHSPCVLPDKFWPVVSSRSYHNLGGNFPLLQTHKRQEFSVADLNGSLDVEEKSRTKTLA
jgi:hypothetical protein